MQRLAACILMVLGLPCAAQGPGSDSTRRTPFTHYGAPADIELAGDGATAHVDFGARGDELATQAALRLRYAISPALSVKLTLNDEVIGVLAATAGVGGEPVERVVTFDPRLVVGYNRLTLTLVAAPGATPPAAGGAWARVSGKSELELTVRPLALNDELAALPEPFFDRHDQRRVVIPFVFAGQPSLGTLRAGAIVASWFGALASWRGARFPVSLGEAVPGHCVVFATNAERPAFLAAQAPVAGPTLRIATNPADGHSKLLVVMGRDAEDLAVAARALALGKVTLAGASVAVKPFEEPAPRARWDAPAILRVDRPTRFAELAEGPASLEASGAPANPAPVRINLRVPPELTSGGGPGVPLRLALQYAAPACASEARLEISIDDELVQVVPMRVAREPLKETLEVTLPSSRLRPRVQLALAPRFVPREDPACRAARDTVKVAFSGDSTIDLSGLEPRGRLPDLAGFAWLGSPFTRHADLSQTVVVLPAQPAPPDLETAYALLGRMGEATGVAATRVRFAAPGDDAALAGCDLLVIGAPTRQPLLERWSASLPVDPPGPSHRAQPVSFESGGPVAMVIGFESPLSPGRSVIAVTAIVAEQVPRVIEALEDGDQRRAFGGSVAYVLPGKVESARVGPTYPAGFVPTWQGALEWLLAHPIGLAGVVLAVGALGVGGWSLTRRTRTGARS